MAAIEDCTRAIETVDGVPALNADQIRLTRGGLLSSRAPLYRELGEKHEADADEAASKEAFGST